MAFEGQCHCGTVAFRVEGDLPTQALSCNCSHCRAKGLLLAFVPGDALAITAGEAALTDYFFNKHAIAHRFCKTCGVQPFGMGKGPDGAQMAAINLRCVPAADLGTLTIQDYDGASA